MFDERFARQYRYEPPSEFPLSLLCTGIVHHLSGPNRNAQTQTSINQLVGCTCKDPGYHFHCVNSLNTNKLANLLDSLVRVSRRVKWSITFMQWARLAPLPKETRGTAPSNKSQAAYHVKTYSQHTLCKSLMHVWYWHAASPWHAKQDTLYTHTSTGMHITCTLLDVSKLQSC